MRKPRPSTPPEARPPEALPPEARPPVRGPDIAAPDGVAGPGEATPAGAAVEARSPERTCIVSRRKGPPAMLIRFVVAPDRSVVPDLRRRLPGRGAWVWAERAAVADAVRRKSFARAFKAEVAADPQLAEMIDGLLEKDALQSLAIANKAGLVVAGAAKVEGSIGPHRPAALVHARDGSPDGIRKLEASVRRRIGDAADGIARIRIFRSDQLDLALGRTNVVHAAVAGGPAGGVFVSRTRRLDRYRGMPLAEAAESARPLDE